MLRWVRRAIAALLILALLIDPALARSAFSSSVTVPPQACFARQAVVPILAMSRVAYSASGWKVRAWAAAALIGAGVGTAVAMHAESPERGLAWLGATLILAVPLATLFAPGQDGVIWAAIKIVKTSVMRQPSTDLVYLDKEDIQRTLHEHDIWLPTLVIEQILHSWGQSAPEFEGGHVELRARRGRGVAAAWVRNPLETEKREEAAPAQKEQETVLYEKAFFLPADRARWGGLQNRISRSLKRELEVSVKRPQLGPATHFGSMQLLAAIENAVDSVLRRYAEHESDYAGKIRVRITESPGTMRLVISDNGVGFTPGQLKSLFRYSGVRVTHKTRMGAAFGSGWRGESIQREYRSLIEQDGGEIVFLTRDKRASYQMVVNSANLGRHWPVPSSRKERGTDVTFTLPKSRPAKTSGTNAWISLGAQFFPAVHLEEQLPQGLPALDLSALLFVTLPLAAGALATFAAMRISRKTLPAFGRHFLRAA